MNTPIKTLLAACAACFALVTTASAYVAGSQLASVNLSSSTDLWTDLSASGTGISVSYPGTASWGGTIISQTGSTSSVAAELVKVSNGTGGGPYPSGSSIYFGGYSPLTNNDGGTLAVEAPAISGLSAVVFQIEIGEAWTYDFYNDVLPVLTYKLTGDNTVYTLASFDSGLGLQSYQGTVLMDGVYEDLYINSYYLVWDFTGISNVESITLTFTGVQHAQLYALRLDQSTGDAGDLELTWPEEE